MSTQNGRFFQSRSRPNRREDAAPPPVGGRLTNAELATKTQDELRTLPVVMEKLQEAEMQLAIYRETLQRTDGESLKLHTHAVVSIGLERLVW